jgi:hypothetical protein
VEEAPGVVGDARPLREEDVVVPDVDGAAATASTSATEPTPAHAALRAPRRQVTTIAATTVSGIATSAPSP